MTIDQATRQRVDPRRDRLRLLPRQLVFILLTMLAMLVFIFAGLGGAVALGRLVGSHKDTADQVKPRTPKTFGLITALNRGSDYRSFDASGGAAGQIGPASITVNTKTYVINAGTQLYGPGCPVVAQAAIPFPPACFVQLGLADDGKTVTFVTTMATPVPDDSSLPLTYKSKVFKSNTRELDLSDGTVLRWGNNPKFDANCKSRTRNDFAGVLVQTELDRFIGYILAISCPDPAPPAPASTSS